MINVDPVDDYTVKLIKFSFEFAIGPIRLDCMPLALMVYLHSCLRVNATTLVSNLGFVLLGQAQA